MNRSAQPWYWQNPFLDAMRRAPRPGEDPFTSWMNTVYGPLWKATGEFWSAALDPSRWMPPAPRGTGTVHDCACDPCACTVCDADVTVTAYALETRVIPVTVENTRATTRHITASVSEWTTSLGQRIPLPTTVVPNGFDLGPCEEKSLAVVVRLSGEKRGDNTDEANPDANRPADDSQDGSRLLMNASPNEARQVVENHGCVVLYANLTIDGCDVRPVRIALAVLPRECGAYMVRCGCGRCC